MSQYMVAEKLYKENKYNEAYDILITEINEQQIFNKFAYATFGRICRKLNKQQEFLNLIQPLIEKQELIDFTNDFFADTIGWCIYDLYVSKYDESCSYDLIEKSQYILINCKQKKLDEYKFNPFVITIFTIIKVLKNKSNTNYKKIIELLEKLDPQKLPLNNSDNFFEQKKEKIELCSCREFYYLNLSKAYEKTEQYSKAYLLCDVALNDTINWHSKNEFWIKLRKYYCLCQENIDFDLNITKYKRLAEEKNEWFLFRNLGNLLIGNNKIDDGFYYLCLAFDVSSHPENKYKVMIDIANVLLNNYYLENEAKKFYQAALYFVNLNGWKINKDLEYKKEKFNLSKEEKPNLLELKKITLKHLYKEENINVGTIKMINLNKGYGFIKTEEKDVYFKTKNIRNNNLHINTFVSFEIVKYGDKIEAQGIKKI